MPELPEVEQFRKILEPLVSDHDLKLQLTKENPPRKWLAEDDIASVAGYRCTAALRKGKQLCLVLEKGPLKKYLYLHMGMTGHVLTADRRCSFGHKNPDDKEPFPTRFCYLLLTAGDYQVAFSDSRKFGSCQLADNLSGLDALAPDALEASDEEIVVIEERLARASLGIKALLLDQKRAVSGVGNWVADEVLYQCEIHPDQTYLTEEQAKLLRRKMHEILAQAVGCLAKGTGYPDTWLFGYRWTKKKAGKDYQGRSLTFLTSGGRTSAIVSSIQKLRKSAGVSSPAKRKRALQASPSSSPLESDAKLVRVTPEPAPSEPRHQQRERK